MRYQTAESETQDAAEALASAGSDADPFVILGMREPEAIQYDEEVDFSGFGEGE